MYTAEENDSVSKSKFCEHVFHTECYKEWLSGLQKTCPYCRCSVLDESTKLKYISHEYEDVAYESYVLNKFMDFLMMIGIGIWKEGYQNILTHDQLTPLDEN